MGGWGAGDVVLTLQLAQDNMPGAQQQQILAPGFSGELGEKCISLVQMDSHPGHPAAVRPRRFMGTIEEKDPPFSWGP